MRTSSSKLISIQTHCLLNTLRRSHNVTQNDLIILLWEPCAISTSRYEAKDAACRTSSRERASEAQASTRSKILWYYYEKIKGSWPDTFFGNPDDSWMLSALLEARGTAYNCCMHCVLRASWTRDYENIKLYYEKRQRFSWCYSCAQAAVDFFWLWERWGFIMRTFSDYQLALATIAVAKADRSGEWKYINVYG